MNVCDEIPVGIFDVFEADVAKDAGVVDEDVDATERVDGGLDDLLAVDDVVVVGNGVAAGCFDFLDD